MMAIAATTPGLVVVPALQRWTRLGGADRLLLGFALSPLVVVAVFFAARAIGVSVVATSYLVLALGGLAAGWVWVRARRRGGADGGGETEGRGEGAGGEEDRTPRSWRPHPSAFLFALPGLLLQLWVFGHPQIRSNQGHVWMHADPVYGLLNGALVPEETLLAGTHIGYPFLPYAYQAVLSVLQDQSPVFSFIWPHVFLYLTSAALAERIMASLGASGRARAFGILWLCFGINPLGYAIEHFSPDIVSGLGIWGEIRWAAWMQKYLQASHMPYAQTAFLALYWVALTLHGDFERRGAQVVLLVLTGMAGLMYPFMYLQAVVFVAALGVGLALERANEGWSRALRAPLQLMAGGIVVSTVMLMYLMLLGQDKGDAPVMFRSTKAQVLDKAPEILLVVLPGAVGLWGLRRRRDLWTAPIGAAVVTVWVSMALYVCIFMPGIRNEYKFVYPIGVLIFPFVPLLLDRWLSDWSRTAWSGFVAGSIAVLLGLAIHHNTVYTEFGENEVPHLVTNGLEPRLKDATPLAAEQRGLYDALRTRTPPDTIVVIGYVEHHMPTMTLRPWWVTPEKESFVTGFNFPWLATLAVRGYDLTQFDERIASLKAFFAETPDPSAVEHFLALGRPVAIVVEVARFPEVARYLEASGRGERIFEDARYRVWLLRTGGRS